MTVQPRVLQRTGSTAFGPAMALATALALAGCAGLQQFPDTSRDYTTALPNLDPNYDAALKEIYTQGKTDDDKIRIRNYLIELRLGVLDAHFEKFVASLSKNKTAIDLGVSLVGVGVGGAGALVSQPVSQILSAASGGLTGAQAAYDKAVLYDQALPALIAQMHAGRKAISARIFQHWKQSIETYPLWVARRDLDAYQYAGSLPGAVQATAADAKEKERQADVILLEAITPEAVTKAAFDRRKKLENAVDGLNLTKAEALVTAIETAFPKSKQFVANMYPSAKRAKDKDVAKVRILLKRMVVNFGLTPEGMDKWQSAIDGL